MRLFLLLFLSLSVFAEDWKEKDKIQGEYTIEKVSRTRDGSFRIVWKQQGENSKPHTTLVILTRESHMDIVENRTMRISAVVDKVHDDYLEVMQIQVQFDDGRSLWLLSEKGKNIPKRGESYLKMHAPKSDYQVL